MTTSKVAIIGCGNLGKAILKGLIEDQTYPTENIIATKRDISTLDDLKDCGATFTSDNTFAITQSEILLVALKPHNIVSILKELKPVFDPSRHVLVSLATGITIEQLQEVVGKDIPILRAMPNTAADVKESLTCIACNGQSQNSVPAVKYFFDKIGTSIIIDEKLMESATVLGACGIAYVLRFIRAMIQGGIEIGFDARTAAIIVNQTVKGASQLLIERKQHPEHEIDKVTTPKGCTITGLNEMEHNGFSSALIKGIMASFEKIEKK